jgi:hypothetical protein
MKLKNVIAVSGHPSLMELVSTRNNGLILKDPITKKSSFFSMRIHQFTPLETVGIYTMIDTIELKEVFKRMLDRKDDLPPISPKATPLELSKYFGEIVPEYDRERVYANDIKKVIKWFNTLNEIGYLSMTDEDVIEEKDNVE